MLISTHGVDAETVAASNLEEAEAEGDAADIIVWREIAKKIAGIRAEDAPLDPQP